jgi:hypothetical protein
MFSIDDRGSRFFPKRCYVFNILHFPEDRSLNIESRESLRWSQLIRVQTTLSIDVIMSALLGISIGVKVSVS